MQRGIHIDPKDAVGCRYRVRSGIVALLALLVATTSACRHGKTDVRAKLESAESFFVAGDYGSAEVEYKNVLRAAPGETLALGRMGTIWAARGGPFQAGSCFQQVKELAPRDVDARLGLARALLAVGNRTATRAEALEILKLEPGNGDALMLLAETSFGEAEVGELTAQLSAPGMAGSAELHVARAILALRSEDPEAAGQALKRAEELDGGLPPVFSVKAHLHLVRKEESAAEECLLKALRLAPLRSPERAAYASFLLDRGRKKEAVDLLDATTKEASDFMTAWRMLALIALEDKNPLQAGKLLESVFARDANDYEAAMLQCRAWFELGGEGEIAKAVELMEALGKVHPANPLIEVRLARAHLMAGKPSLAAAALRRALELDPNLREAALMDAALKIREGEGAGAARSMEVWLEAHPGDGEALWILADAYCAEPKPDKAVEILKSLAAADASDFRYHFRLGKALRRMGSPKEARIALEKAEALEPSSLPVAAELVSLDIQSRDYGSALQRAENQRSHHSESASPHFLKATVMVQESKWSEAEDELRAALRLDPGLAAARELLVTVHLATGRVAAAQDQLEQLREIVPGSIQVLMALGGIYDQAGRGSEARQCYEEVLNQDREHVTALNNLAAILGESAVDDDLQRARKLAGLARYLKGDDPAIADTLGWILFRQGDYGGAYGLLEEAASKVDDPLVKFHFGMACRAMADEQGAREAFRAAAAAGSDFPGRPEATRHLARLEAGFREGDAGIRDLEQQVEQDPADMVARLRLAQLFEAEGRHREAADAYAGALKVNAELHRAVSRLAHLYAGPLNDAEKARDYARKAKILNPGDARAAAIMGAQAYRDREFERADLMFRESLATIKDDTGLMMQGAWAAYSVGRLDEARVIMGAVIARSQDSRELADGKRFLEFQSEDCPADAINRALESDPAYVPALMARAARAEKKDRTASIQDYEKVLEVFPRFAPARSAIKRIRAQEKPDS